MRASFLMTFHPDGTEVNTNHFIHLNMATANEIESAIRAFVVENIFAGKDNADLKGDTKLISSRLMDSIVALKLVSHLEEKFGIEFEAHEVDQDNLDTLDSIAKFVHSKLK